MELDLHLKTDGHGGVSFTPSIQHKVSAPGIVKRPTMYNPSPLGQEYDYGGVHVPNGLAKVRVKKNRLKRFNKQVAPDVMRDIVSTPSGPQTFVGGVSAPRRSVTTPSRYYPSLVVDEPTVADSPDTLVANKLRQYMADHANDPETPGSSSSPLFPQSPLSAMANKLRQYMVDHADDPDTPGSSSSPLFS